MRPALGEKNHVQCMRDLLVARIVDGTRPPGAPWPSAADLARESAVSPITARRVLALLKREGLIDLRQGRAARTAASFSALPLGGVAAVFVADYDARRQYGCDPCQWHFTSALLRKFGQERQPGLLLPLERWADMASRDAFGALVFVDLASRFRSAYAKIPPFGKPYAILHDSGLSGADSNEISFDYAKAVDRAAMNLVVLGMKRIVIVSCLRPHVEDDILLASLRRTLASLDFDLTQIRRCDVPDFFEASGQNAMARLIGDGLPRRTAVITSGDLLARGVIKAGLQRGWHLKKDFVVFGRSGLPEAARWDPALTTFQQPFTEAALATVTMLKEQRRTGRNQSASRVLPVKFILRKS